MKELLVASTKQLLAFLQLTTHNNYFHSSQPNQTYRKYSLSSFKVKKSRGNVFGTVGTGFGFLNFHVLSIKHFSKQLCPDNTCHLECESYFSDHIPLFPLEERDTFC
jgi:hypothetical protein